MQDISAPSTPFLVEGTLLKQKDPLFPVPRCWLRAAHSFYFHTHGKEGLRNENLLRSKPHVDSGIEVEVKPRLELKSCVPCRFYILCTLPSLWVPIGALESQKVSKQDAISTKDPLSSFSLSTDIASGCAYRPPCLAFVLISLK